jgi:hypothetical protein
MSCVAYVKEALEKVPGDTLPQRLAMIGSSVVALAIIGPLADRSLSH